jgi:sortase A
VIRSGTGRRFGLRAKNFLSWALSLVLIGAGVALIASFFLAANLGSTATNTSNPGRFNVPELDTTQQGVAAEGPEDKTLRLTIPEMARIKNDTVPYAEGDNERALKENAAIHLKGTGSPWQEEANVYLAGHRLGYPRTDSFLAFWDLNKLEKGDRVFVTDADGTEYTYEVFKEFIVSPTDLSVTDPVEGKNILTLQTCTLPDYSQRLIVQAELVNVARKGEPGG